MKVVLLMAACSGLFACRALNFYGEPDKPIYSRSQEETAAAIPADSLNVVTFNIKKARKIDLAIAEMKQLEEKKPVGQKGYRQRDPHKRHHHQRGKAHPPTCQMAESATPGGHHR